MGKILNRAILPVSGSTGLWRVEQDGESFAEAFPNVAASPAAPGHMRSITPAELAARFLAEEQALDARARTLVLRRGADLPMKALPRSELECALQRQVDSTS